MLENLDLAKKTLDVTPLLLRFIRREVKTLSNGKLPFAHYRIIAYISRYGKTTNRALSEWQGVSFPAMSRMVDGLVTKGVLQREKDKVDRRQIQVQLTVKGKQIWSKVRNALEHKMVQRVQKLTDTQKDQLNAGLTLIETLLGENP